MNSIIHLNWNNTTHMLSFEITGYCLLVLAVLILILISRLLLRRKDRIVEMNIEISGSPKVVFKLKRDYSNLYIANRIYVELVTRKTALPFEEEKDVIVEIYDSWYKLFALVREEMKTVQGQFLQKKDSGAVLVILTTELLNKGLRPHLTKYQAAFRRWYEQALKNQAYSEKSPQQIQEQYASYQELVEDMREVNKILTNYANQLKQFIEGV